MKFKFYSIVIVIIVVLLSACSNHKEEVKKEGHPKKEAVSEATSQKKSDGQNNQKKYEVLMSAKTPPQTIEELVNYPIGEFSGKKYTDSLDEFVERMKEYPPLNDAHDPKRLDAYFNTMYALFANEFRSPVELVNSWKEQSFGSPEIEDERYHFKDQFNVEIILDSSGSMAGKIGGKTKMEIAKEVISHFTSSLPEGTKVGLRVYGHKGTNSESDKKRSCESTDLVYGISPYDPKSFNQSLNELKPAGWTATALALSEAQKDLSTSSSTESTNIIYLVSDGIETCGGDPAKAAKQIADSQIQPIINVIGFDVDAAGKNQLKEVAKSANGTYSSVDSQDQLKNELDKAKEMAQKWSDWKRNASSKANITYYNRGFDALAFQNRWASANHDQNDNMWYTLMRLRDEGQISKDVYSYLDQRRQEEWKLIIQLVDQVYDDLNKINEDNHQEMLKQIEEKYMENN